jgi:hypothetical protein
MHRATKSSSIDPLPARRIGCDARNELSEVEVLLIDERRRIFRGRDWLLADLVINAAQTRPALIHHLEATMSTRDGPAHDGAVLVDVDTRVSEPDIEMLLPANEHRHRPGELGKDPRQRLGQEIVRGWVLASQDDQRRVGGREIGGASEAQVLTAWSLRAFDDVLIALAAVDNDWNESPSYPGL